MRSFLSFLFHTEIDYGYEKQQECYNSWKYTQNFRSYGSIKCTVLFLSIPLWFYRTYEWRKNNRQATKLKPRSHSDILRCFRLSGMHRKARRDRATTREESIHTALLSPAFQEKENSTAGSSNQGYASLISSSRRSSRKWKSDVHGSCLCAARRYCSGNHYRDYFRENKRMQLPLEVKRSKSFGKCSETTQRQLEHVCAPNDPI